MGLECANEDESVLEAVLAQFKCGDVGIDRDRGLIRDESVQGLFKMVGVRAGIDSEGVITYTILPDEGTQTTLSWRVFAFSLSAAASKCLSRESDKRTVFEMLAAFFERVASNDSVCIAREVREVRR